MHCGSRKPSLRWQGKRDCGAHNATLKNLQHTTISPIEEGQHLARNAFKLHLAAPHNTIPSHLLLWDSRPPLRSNERTNTGMSEASLHLVSGSLQLITENGREGISAASVHARLLPSKSNEKWFIKKYNLYTNCLALPTCTHVDLRTSSRLILFSLLLSSAFFAHASLSQSHCPLPFSLVRKTPGRSKQVKPRTSTSFSPFIEAVILLPSCSKTIDLPNSRVSTKPVLRICIE